MSRLLHMGEGDRTKSELRVKIGERALSSLSKEGCLNTALAGTFELPMPSGGLASGMTVSDWVATQEIYGSSFGMDLRIIGFTRKGYIAVRQLIKLLRATDLRCRRLVGHSTLLNQVLKHIKAAWMQGKRSPITVSDVGTLEDHIQSWLQSFHGRRTHFIPCAILPGAAQSFAVGPVRFMHIEQFDPAKQGFIEWEKVSRRFLSSMTSQSATWIGIVDIDDCEPQRSAEIGDLTIDLALGAIQSILPDYCARNMTRVTARNVPPDTFGVVLRPGGHWATRWECTEAGRNLLPDYFDQSIKLAMHDLDRMGRRIDAYRSGKASLPKLEQAWCDAAYWFHEGLSELLDSVAVIKLEISIENLFAAGSVKESKARLLSAFEHLLGFS
jgi:hypothetical protein